MAGAFAPRGGPVPQPRPEDFENAEDYYNALWGATGIPLMQEGVSDVAGAFGPDGSASDVPLGVGKAALGALPFVGPAARAAFATVPRAMSMGGLYGGLPMVTSDSAEAQSKKAAPAPVPEPDADGLVQGLLPDQYSELQKLNAKISKSAWSSGAERRTIEARVKDLNAAATRAIERKLTMKGELENKKALDAQAIANKEAAATQERDQAYKDANTPIKEKYPGLGYAIPAITGALAFGSGALLRGRGIGQNRRALDEVTTKIDEALRARTLARQSGNAAAADDATDLARRLTTQQQKLVKDSKGIIGPGGGKALAAGATFGIAGKVLPDEIDAQRALPGSPLEKDVMSRWDSIPEAAKNLAIGAVSGLSAAEMGSVARKAGSFSRGTYTDRSPEIDAQWTPGPGPKPNNPGGGGPAQPDLSGMNNGYVPPKGAGPAGPNNPPPDGKRFTSDRAKFWRRAFKIAEKEQGNIQDKEKIISEILALNPGKYYPKAKAAAAKRRMAQELRGSQSTTGEGLSRKLQSLRRSMKDNGTYSVAPIAAGLGIDAATRTPEEQD